MTALKKVKQEMENEIKSIRQEARERTLGYITGAFGVVAGLAWNDFVKALIENVFPPDKNATLWAKLTYAGIMTFMVVGITIYLTRIFKEGEEKKSTTEEVAK